MNHELKKALDLKFAYLGDSEAALAFSRAREKTEAAIAEQIELHRKPFERSRTSAIGSATFASAEAWRSIAADSEKAARATLLSSSPEMAQLSELEARALAAKQAADAKERELQAAWSEFQSIPEKAQKLTEKLNAIADELTSLDATKIEADIRELYRATLNGAVADPLAQVRLAGLLVTAPLRKEVLNKLTEELNRELTDIKARAKILWKKLGLRSPL